ncbi:hypothetical protein FACS189483_03660 [Spirochaetia bacterium]|nr:hypothetical protein FACS189483_03660 [Spirochaetia bacterium]
MNNIDSVRKELDNLAKIIFKYFTVDQIYVFGSYSCVISNNYSDFSLFIFLASNLLKGTLGDLYNDRIVLYSRIRK